MADILPNAMHNFNACHQTS